MSVKNYQGNDQVFLNICKAAGIKPTRRQWTKFNQKRGQAYKAKTSN